MSTQATGEPSFAINHGRSTQVTSVFPSSNLLPENLLRFYVCFSNSMQRGRAGQEIALFGPDGRPAVDTLYRPPVELWDRSMRHLTVLLDPGRLKRRVGPNRELGPPLKAGQYYTLHIGSSMLDFRCRTLRDSFQKSFLVTDPVRQPVAIDQWKLVAPLTGSDQPVALTFPSPLDWAMLWSSIDIRSNRGQRVNGRIAIDQAERRWSFIPTSPWAAGKYEVHISPGLEDVCGNNLLGMFDRRLRPSTDLQGAPANHSISFQLT